MTFPLASVAFAERAAVILSERAESRLVEYAFEAFVAAILSSEESGSAGLSQYRCHSCGGGERVGEVEPGEVSCLRDEFRGEHGPHAGQATDEGRVRVAMEHFL